MNDACIIEHLADGTHSCRTHQSIGYALCHHAVAVLQARVVEPTEQRDGWKATSEEIAVHRDQYGREAAEARTRVRELEATLTRENDHHERVLNEWGRRLSHAEATVGRLRGLLERGLQYIQAALLFDESSPVMVSKGEKLAEEIDAALSSQEPPQENS